MRIYRLIDEESQRQEVSRWCRALGVSRSGFYEWKQSPLSQRQLDDAALLALIDQVFAESRQTYGSPRIHAELRLGHGLRVGRKRVERLMRRGRLVAVSSRKRRGATCRDAARSAAPDLVCRDFHPSAPDQLWIADFCQVATWQGIAYVAVVADAFSRLCLGWSLRSDKTTQLVIDALEMAIWRRGQQRAAQAVHHSDHGSQYTSFAFTRRLAAAGLTPSMGTVGDALDNAMCESLIGSLKVELLNRHSWESFDDVSAAVFEWIEAWYNRRRRHSALGYLSPLEYESQHLDGITPPTA
ncbi:MAG TPA: IS3 family transposase [Solirubrobacteraceae bacterium]|nr:IS3 family transposase [Solirubrobacteraceae bacterium]